MRRALLTGLAALLLVACVEDLPTGAELDRPRVLGGRALLPDGRAWPAAGETFDYEFFVDAPLPTTTWTSSIFVCLAGDSNVGIPGCDGAPFVTQLPEAPREDGPPPVAITVPGDAAGGELLFLGVICADGTPSIDVEAGMFDCTPLSDALPTTTTVLTNVLEVIDPARDANRHPTILEDSFRFETVAWAPVVEPLPETRCGSVAGTSALPLVEQRDPETDEPNEITWGSDPADREEFLLDILGQDEPELENEDLRYSHLVTTGRLNRFQTVVFDEEPPRPITWEHPDPEEVTVPPEGLTVRFVFVVRDERGGADITERAICLVPDV